MSVMILIEKHHDLTDGRALAMRQEYTDSNPISITADVVEWQRARYGSDLKPAEFREKTDPHQVFGIITQMLWERREYGYPWKKFSGLLVPLTK